MKKKYIFISIIIICLVVFSSFKLGILFEKKNNQSISLKKNIKKNGIISMMLETGSNTDKYELTTANEWPTSGYKFNSKLSKCENGGSLSWDYANKNVVMEGTTSDKCYIYFDKIVTVNEYCSVGTNLADCIKTYGNAGYDTSSIYIHDSSLKNGAGDNSYRFAGASDYVNNYVCFGSDAETCPSDNLYRIIGVFGDQVKLIKADFATKESLGENGTYFGNTFASSDYSTYKGELTTIDRYSWNTSSNTNVWNESNLNTVNLNSNYLSSLGDWANMIDTTTWKVGGNTFANIADTPMYSAYQNEIVSPAENTTYSAKIGLMYVSDYGYATIQTYWTYEGHGSSDSTNDYRKTLNENWLGLGILEWTITRLSDATINVFNLGSGGRVDGNNNNVGDRGYGIRPCFYLKNSINYNGGSGTKDSPIRLENTEATLANHVKSQYTGTQGENSIYYHNGTIKSGDTVIDANDGSYRYAGANPNNYVCFGSDAETCPNDNLYRIIGVFNNRVKLIKADYATSDMLGEDGTYDSTSSITDYPNYKGNLSTLYWYHWNDSTNTNIWSESNLNTVNLNTNYLNNFDNTWKNLIANTTWQVGGNAYINIATSAMYEAYQNEIVSPVELTTYSAKIGLMYVSDYGYAASSNYWTYNGYNSEDSTKDYRAAINNNWMYSGVTEWTITRRSDYTNRTFGIYYTGLVHSRSNDGVGVYTSVVRPAFYLNSNVTYTRGSGTADDPYHIA